ncbi:MAG: arylsulfatase [Bacteroidota bacterium]
MKKLLLSLAALCLIAVLVLSFQQKKEQATQPNIVLIMVDDMGYSDIGCYGSEIPTPNIDRLAENGLRFSQFYNTARCCPTRASLLTGLFPAQTGIGHMTKSPKDSLKYEDWGTEGYIGYLNKNCMTIAEVLKGAGYNTYMTGKWHLGYHRKERWPLERGFDKYYGIIAGASSYFWPNGKRGLTYMDEHISPPDSNTYYTTDAFTDYAVQFIDEQKDDKPFFLYLAYNAPHWPLHAKDEDIEKFVGKYMHGWDEVRKARFKKQVEMGLFENVDTLSQRDERVRAWEVVDEEQKRLVDYRMAVYAAQIYSIDYNVGKVIQKLEEEGTLDNTLILFLSDNGGCAEMYHEFGTKPQSWINKTTYSGAVSYGIGWANASNTPFREYKVQQFEGGIATPLIAHWPDVIKKQQGKITNTPSYLIDIMPTLLDISKAEYPAQYKGKNIHPLEGESLVAVFKKGDKELHEYMYWEHQSNCAIRYGNWKAIKKLTDTNWQLYNLENDRIEAHDLASENPDMVNHLNDKWYEWANSHLVLPKRVSKNEAKN